MKVEPHWNVRAIDAGGRRIAAYFYQRTGPRLAVHDLHTGQQLAETVLEPGSAATVLQFLPSGRLLLARTSHPPALWDPASMPHFVECQASGPPARIYTVILACSPDERLAVTVGRENELILWDLERLEERQRSPRLRSHIEALAFSPDSATLAVFCNAVWEGNLILSSAETWAPRRALTVPAPTRSTLQYSPDGQSLVIAHRAGLQVLDVSTGQERLRLRWTTREGTVLLGPDGRLTIRSGPSGEVRLWPAEVLFGPFPT
jgi:hypothetical protein